MLLFGVCFVLYFIKLSAGKGFQLVEHQTFNLRARGSSPLSGFVKLKMTVIFLTTDIYNYTYLATALKLKNRKDNTPGLLLHEKLDSY